MPNPAAAIPVVASTILSSSAQRSAAKSAAGAQVQSAQMGIDEQRRQFDVMQELLSPYVQGGTSAFQAQMDLLGIGPDVPEPVLRFDGVGPNIFGTPIGSIKGTARSRQDAAIRALEMSPQFQALARQGEEALLQNASATGGLRGGNLQGALAQFRPAMLQQQIQQQFANLGGLAQFGQASAARAAAGAQAAGTNIGSLLQQQGAAQAGGILGAGAATANLLNLPVQFAGLQMARGGSSLFGGTQAPAPIVAATPMAPAGFDPNYGAGVYGGTL